MEIKNKIDNYIKTSDLIGRRRKIKYVITGMNGYFAFKKGELKDLLFAIGYLIVPSKKAPIPSFKVINDILKTGKMTDCIWSPFQINKDEYDDLVTILKNDKSNTYYLIESPVWITTFNDWLIWLDYYNYCVPIERNRELSNEYNKWDDLLKKAISNNNDKDIKKYHSKACRVGLNRSKFVQTYINKLKSPDEIKEREAFLKDFRHKYDNRLKELDDEANS